MSIARLASRARRDLAYLAEPSREWTIPRERHGARVLDVLIVGAGQGGLAIGAALQRERISNFRIVDRNRKGAEGPWRRFARMRELRTIKDVNGIDLGIPSLTMRAYYEARFGRDSWARIDKLPPGVWLDYLHWFRDVLALPVENETELAAIEEDGGLLLATLLGPGGEQRLHARKIVLATGIEGGGFWRSPPALVAGLPAGRFAHAADDIDFAALAGKRIAVLGVGPSAFDNAAAALEAGAARVDLCFRRKEIPRVNPLVWMYFSGMLGQFAELDDLARWRFMRRIIEELPAPPPQDVFWRCRAHDNFAWHGGCAWRSVQEKSGELVIETAGPLIVADFIIFATGFETDLTARPELRCFVRHIALWQDRFTPPAGEESDLLARHPYLGGAFEFTERVAGEAPYLSRLHNFTLAAMPSLGLTGSATTGIKYGVPRLVGGIARDLFREDADRYYQSLLSYDEQELKTLDTASDWIECLATDALARFAVDEDGPLAGLVGRSDPPASDKRAARAR